MSGDVRARVVRLSDGSLALDDPDALGVIQAVEHHNRSLAQQQCHQFWTQNEERMHELADRVFARESERRDVLVCISDDDRIGSQILGVLMPGHDFDQYRRQGLVPVGRGIVPRELLLALLDELPPRDGQRELRSATPGKCDVCVIACDAEIVSRIDSSARRKGA